MVVALIFFFCLSFMPACKKFVAVPAPDTQIVAEKVFADEQLANAAVAGLYARIMNAFGFMNGYMSRYAGLYSDELTKTTLSGADTFFLFNKLTGDDMIVSEIWSSAYSYIYQANAIIEGLHRSTVLNTQIRDQLSAEATFIRAMSYFYIVNLFGDVPLVLTTDYTSSSVQSRTPASQVYQQLVTDLANAQASLPSYHGKTDSLPASKIRATRWAAAALLSRVYLYQKDWLNAERQASFVIDSGPFHLMADLSQVFLATSDETILQFVPLTPVFSTAEGAYFLPTGVNGKPNFILSDTMVKAFEAGDARKSAWTKTTSVIGKDYCSPYKYKVLQSNGTHTEYNIVFRLAEQYLIRAEARVQLAKTAEAANDINTIRLRAGLPALPASPTQLQLLMALIHERQTELFTEWGHRWFDLRRWPSLLNPSDPQHRSADDILPAIKGANWQPYKIVWPVPSIELRNNIYLVQNQGY